MNSSLAIAIPVYNNVSLLNECLHSLVLQTYKKFDVYLYDDTSTEDYLEVLKNYSSLSINYNRNSNNLGALANMQFAYNELKEKYRFVMIMHEDDLLHHQFVEMVINEISANEKPAFVISNFISFDISNELKKSNELEHDNECAVLLSKKELSLLFLKLKPLAFGSVVYNTSVYNAMNLNFEQYEEFADRPFLLNELNDKSKVALISKPLYHYRSHGITDNRWKKLMPQHVFNLLELYKEILLKSEFITKSIFNKYAMAFVFDAYNNLLLTGKTYYFIPYLFKAKMNGFFSLKYTLLKNSKINKAATRLKELLN